MVFDVGFEELSRGNEGFRLRVRAVEREVAILDSGWLGLGRKGSLKS